KAYANRELLRELSTVLKTDDALLEFVFLTGVSKFSKTGIFSGLNNLVDLSPHPDYATMLGYTQQELESNFPEEIAAAAQKLKLDRQELLDQMREWYNGYRFEENAETVYNPVSVNSFFNQNKFENFWFATGTPTFLVQLLKQDGVFDLHAIGQSTLDFDSFDLEDIRLFGLLYQTGYLTIQSRDEFGQYTLDYPNREVKNSMLAYLFEAFGGVS
ncbi:MAG: AAA family ATPase, partial [Pirellulaceae bacterium]